MWKMFQISYLIQVWLIAKTVMQELFLPGIMAALSPRYHVSGTKKLCQINRTENSWSDAVVMALTGTKVRLNFSNGNATAIKLLLTVFGNIRTSVSIYLLSMTKLGRFLSQRQKEGQSPVLPSCWGWLPSEMSLPVSDQMSGLWHTFSLPVVWRVASLRSSGH